MGGCAPLENDDLTTDEHGAARTELSSSKANHHAVEIMKEPWYLTVLIRGYSRWKLTLFARKVKRKDRAAE